MTCRETEQLVMPYIRGELSLETLKDFLEHIDSCDNCSEELEIYYTIYRALEQLDNEDQDQRYDMRQLLEEHIRQSTQYVHGAEAMRFVRKLAGAVAAVALVCAVIIQLFLWYI